MIIVLNGPLGIGKSTLAEALTEMIDSCVMLNGDQLIAANPPAADELEHLHSTLVLLVAHHQRFGYRHFVVDHIWRSPAELADLRRRLMAADAGAGIRCFLLTLPADENLRRIERRQRARALDEQEFELRALAEERGALRKHSGMDLGEPFDVSAPPAELVVTMLARLNEKRPPGDWALSSEDQSTPSGHDSSREGIMRKQYYFKESSRGLLAWDVDRLIHLSSELPRKRIPLSRIRELDEGWFGEKERPTWKGMVEHIRLIEGADLSFPIILSASGAVMDGMHRATKAVLQGRRDIEAVQFDTDPEPDYVGREPDDLPY